MTTATETTALEVIDEADDEWTTCDNCNESISQAEYDRNDTLCNDCLASTFVCDECEGRTHRDDAHKVHKGCCDTCGDAREEEILEERLDAAKAEAQELLDAILDGDDLDAVEKVVKALKRLQPK